MIIYSRSVPYGEETSKYDKGVVIFRHTRYNLVFIGDAGFIPQRGISFSGTICPFMINRTEDGGKFIQDLPLKFPIPKKEYKYPVYNSVFFANALAWIIDRAEFAGINSGK